ncbi:MAG: hypothetical protein EOR97_17195 [Mesorhizobium sp.]|uniref:hypothetical protein n=1 Tax=Mesorhizobium sp. TaxID=1871066 RepID=UPI000FEA0A94|nr:hypothetical protein [Mesorhizobium sp.]RWN30108.1 MAG: hypothetical protein EOR97_17195 [Mesorhizobium sp.]
MPADRLKVRDAGAAGYEVVDGASVLGKFSSISDAARFVRYQGARLWLDWGRTVIARQPAPYDFSPTFLGSDSVGRVMGEKHGPSAGTWSWSISTHDDRWRKHGGQRGREATKDAAVAALEAEFTSYLAATP